MHRSLAHVIRIGSRQRRIVPSNFNLRSDLTRRFLTQQETRRSAVADQLAQVDSLLEPVDSNRETASRLEEAHDLLQAVEPLVGFRALFPDEPTTISPAVLERCRALLQAWTQLPTLRPGLPQRAQHLMQRLPPSTRNTNAVLQLWANSHEAHRGSRAEKVFAQCAYPDDETYRWIITAWAQSTERQRAHRATMHLKRMSEPSLDLCRQVLATWVTAE